MKKVKSQMVAHPRFELGTPWLKVRCSANWASEPYGWGSWIRTNECGSQSPVPYRLAIPQSNNKHYLITDTRLSKITWYQLNRQHPILPGGCPPSTFGLWMLNYCVRNGNRWIHPGIATGFMSIRRYSLLKCLHTQNFTEEILDQTFFFFYSFVARWN